ncbi:MAG: DNA repair protein RecN [Muribaculaceae bacterium]|nr:DNA repair protein RecN [Muribaculaceae bacterium]
MIKSLLISNYALISGMEIEFDPGFNIITGETGAGKSIILGALGLLLGERADMRVVRDTARKSVIEAVFGIGDAPGVGGMLSEMGFDSVDGDCILRRELLPGGRSRAFVNDSPVTLPVLRQIAVRLIDIHSQHQNLLLASPDYQLEILDNLAETNELLNNYRSAYAVYRRSLKQYTETRDMIRRNRDDADYIAFQYNELEAMDLQPGEHEALEHERETLSNLDELLEQIDRALTPLSGEPVNVQTALDEAVSAVESLAINLADEDEAEEPEIDFHNLSERLESARIELSDIADTLMNYRESLNADPGRLEEVEERLSQLYSLETKHHVANADELIEIRDRLSSQLTTLEDGDRVLARLEAEAKRAKKAAITLASELSERRTAAAAVFARQLREAASPLGMPNLRCDISFTRGKLGVDGFDQVQYLFAFNKNQALMPLGGAASGGEISRLVLSVRAILAERMHLPSIIFDEVDTGVSGDVATRMAAMMAGMSRSLQVICITHLPGVAAMGRVHFKVYKEDDENSTTTRIRRLDDAGRQAELALMLSGNPEDETALATARTLLSKKL